MLDVWVCSIYDENQQKPAQGAWLCPALGVFGTTATAKAVNFADGLRVGCALGIMAAVNDLGTPLNIHVPRYPNPRWVVDPDRDVPLPNFFQRLVYRMEIHPRFRDRTLQAVPVDLDNCVAQLHDILTRGEVRKGVRSSATVLQ